MPQPRRDVATPYFLVDAVDLAAVAERWHGSTVGGDGHDLGVDIRVDRARFSAVLAVHNGAGTFGRHQGNYCEGGSSPDVLEGPETAGLAASGALTVRAGGSVEVGAFGEVNGTGPARTARGGVGRDYVAGGAHVYWGADPGSQPVRIKVDALALRFSNDGAGVSALGALRVRTDAEAFVRGEQYCADADRYLTTEFSLSPSAARSGPYDRARLTLAYRVRDAATGPTGHLVILQGQLAF